MTPDEFRQIALRLPEVSEGAHQGHADFRVGGKIFATLDPDENRGMVKLSPEDQSSWGADDPESFQPLPGAWGRQGCTRVFLDVAKAANVAEALRAAWFERAPKTLRKRHPR